MSNFPTTPTLAQIAVGDSINYGGQTFQVASVGAVVNHNDGRITATVTLNNSGSTVLTLDTKNTVCSSFNINGAVWSQSAQA